MKALFSLRRVVTLRPQQLIVTPTFTRNSIIRKPDLAWNKSDRRFFETGQISTYKRLRSFLQARNYYGGYKFYTAALESDTKFTADDFLLMLKILAKVDSHKIVEETRRIISAMDAQQVTPTKEHLKAIIECSSNFTLDFVYEIYKEFSTKYRIKLESTVFTAYVEACLVQNDIDRALRFISSITDQDVMIMRMLYVRIIDRCIRNLMPSKAIEIIKIVSASEGAYFTPWEYGALLQSAIQQEEIKAVVFLLQKIKDLDVNVLDEGTIFNIFVLSSKYNNVELAKQMLQRMRDQECEITGPIHLIMAQTYFSIRMMSAGWDYLQTMVDSGFPLSKSSKEVIASIISFHPDSVVSCYRILKAMKDKGRKISIELLEIVLLACRNLKLDGTQFFDTLATTFQVQPRKETYHDLIEGLSSETSMIQTIAYRIEEMKEKGIAPDQDTYYYLLDVCARSGQLDAAEEVLETMTGEELQPSGRHLTRIGLAFARLGEYDACQKVIETLKSVQEDASPLERALSIQKMKKN